MTLGLLSKLTAVLAALSQYQTNKNSKWGTLDAPTFPDFLSNNPLSGGFPWGSLTANGSNPYTEAPNTGVTRRYDFTVTRGQIAPDGYQQDVILVNDQFPGPQIEANWGDTIQVTIRNRIKGPEEGTAFHWHGALQKGSQWYDGVPGVQQCPIAPGESFTYTFRADLYGTSWYHSHYSAQYAGGLLGPMIIYGPEDSSYDVDLGPVFIADWYHKEYYDIVTDIVKPGGDPRPASDNNLINGKMNFDCATVAAGDKTRCTNNAGLSRFKFKTGKTHRLRLINAGADALQRFSIDGHTMTVIANDYVPIKPYNTTVVTLGVGQRTDILVTANQGNSKSAFWMRSNISTACTAAKQPFALAAIYYDRADTTKSPTSSAWNVPDPGTCANDDLALTVPTYVLPAVTPDTVQTYDIGFGRNATGSFLWTLDGTSFRANYNQPALIAAAAGNLTFPPERNVKNFGSNNTIRIIVNNRSPASHPMHLHGHNMMILSEGPGDWDGKIINQINPQRRDVQLVRGNGHFVMQYTSDNPGVWGFHCHIAWHASGGLYAQFINRPDDIKKFKIPGSVPQTCVTWQSYSDSKTVEQIDSGV